MKKVVKADSYVPGVPEDVKVRQAKQVLWASKRLLDVMEDCSAGVLDEFDCGPLYEELVQTIPDLSQQINRR